MPASKEQQWTVEEENLIRALINKGVMLKDMEPYFARRKRRGIEEHVYKMGLKSPNPRTKHSKDEAFWEVPNPINSYFAGILGADGCIHPQNNSISWVCEKTDREALLRFVESTKFTGKIRCFDKQTPNGSRVAVHCGLHVSACQKWSSDLAKVFNVTPQKAHRLAPPVLANDYLMACWLIGYTDGDGCIHIANTGLPMIRYTSASHHLISWIQTFVETRFPVQMRKKSTKIQISTNGTYASYCVNGLRAIKLFELLRSIDIPKFDRKWNHPRFLETAARYRREYPEFFTPEYELAFDPSGKIVFAHTLAATKPIAA